MGTVTKTIGTSSRDYSTVQAWEDALPANLVTDGNIQVGQCFNDSEFVVAGGVLTIAGETVDSTHYIQLTTGSGQSFRDNANKLTNALKYNQSNGVGLRSSTNSTAVITVQVAYTRISNLQIKHTGLVAFGINSTVDHGQYDHLVMEVTDTTFDGLCLQFDSNGGDNTWSDIICIQGGPVAKGARIRDPTSSGGFFNCTFVRPSNFTAASTGIEVRSGTLVVKNCAFFGSTTPLDNVASATTLTANNNASDQTLGFGSSNQNGLTYANQFNQPSNGSGAEDFTLKTGNGLVTNGATLSVTDDIFGQTRPAAWSIGAQDTIAAAASMPAGATMM